MTRAAVDPLRSGVFDAVLFDRDGTLIRDVPYCGDPGRVEPMPGARAALDELRATGLAVGVVSNQSGVGRGLLSRTAVDAVNSRVAELLGPFDTWQVCPHAPKAGCSCRKPAPGLVHAAARALGMSAQRCVVVGDIGADMEAALSVGIPRPADTGGFVVVHPGSSTAARLADCPDPRHPCLSTIDPDQVVRAVRLLAGGPR